MPPEIPPERTFVLYEDREHAVVGLQLAVASLLRHMPEASVRVHLGGSARASGSWFERQAGSVEVLTDPLPGGVHGWNVKPDLLLALLREGHRRAVWLDSDVLVCADLTARLDVPPDVVVATEDMWYGRAQGSGARTRAWGLEVGRLLPATLNTALLQVGQAHVPLVEEWRQLLQDPAYLTAQSQPYGGRDPHVVGDQDVLTALVESRAWQHVDVDLLARGTEIAQCYGSAGFSPPERLRLGRDHAPALVHAMGPKPWAALSDGSQTGYWQRTHLQLTPYTTLAAGYRATVESDLGWTGQATAVTRVLRRLSGNDPVLQELPLSVLQWAHWRLRQDAGRARRGVQRLREHGRSAA